MNRLRAILAMVLSLGIFGNALAQAGTSTENPSIPEFTTRTGWVIDTTGTLSSEHERQLESLAAQIASTGPQVGIAIFSNCACETVLFATEIGDQNELGQAEVRNGVVIAVFLEKSGSGGQKPAIGVAVASGLEGTLTDGRVGRLLDATFVPKRAEGKWAEGVTLFVQELQKFLGGQPSAADDDAVQLTTTQIILIVVGLILFLIVDGVFFRFAILMTIIEIAAYSGGSGFRSSSSGGSSRLGGGGGGFRGGGAGR